MQRLAIYFDTSPIYDCYTSEILSQVFYIIKCSEICVVFKTARSNFSRQPLIFRQKLKGVLAINLNIPWQKTKPLLCNVY